MSRTLHKELEALEVPVRGAQVDGRVALGPPYENAERTGQWVRLPDGSTEWVGKGTPTPAPDSVVLGKIASAISAHVPAVKVRIDQKIVKRALIKAALNEPLTAEEIAELNKAK